MALGTCCVLGASAAGLAAWTLAAVAVSLTLAQLPAVARRLPRGTSPAADLSLALALGAGQLWLGPAGTGAWLFAAIAILSVTCHFEWSSRPGTSWAVALVSIGSYAAFHLVAGGGSVVFAVQRLLLQSLLSYFGLLLLRAAAWRADRAADRVAQSRIEAASGHLRRQAAQTFLAMLHDTACTTFLAISSADARHLEWVRDQCAGDLRTLAGDDEIICGETDLADLTDRLGRIRDHRDLTVRLVLPERIVVERTAADAICMGVAEALTNVARHSGDSNPTVSATTDDGRVRVAVQDAGAGFVPGGARQAGRGIRESIVHRAELAGVGATVTSEPGRGTRVEWTCPSGAHRRPDVTGNAAKDAADDMSVDLVRPVRVAVLTVCLIVQFGLTAPRFVSDVSGGFATPTAVAVFGCLAAVAAGGSVLIWRGGPVPDWAAWAGGSLLLACSVAMSAQLPADVMSRGEHWSFGLVGWYSLVVLFDTALALRLLFLAVHAMIFTIPVFAGPGGLLAVETMWVFIVSVTGMQAWVVFGLGVVRSLAGRAREHVREAADLRLARYCDEVARREHRRRYADIRRTTIPLLEELAVGRLDPASGPARVRCAVEANRLRRLMCAADQREDALHDDVQAVVDDLDRRGIRVQLSLKGAPLLVPLPIRGALLDPVVAAIVAAGATARLTVLREAGAVRVSALCTGMPDGWIPPPPDPRVSANSTRDQDTVWLETVWTT